MLGNDILTNFHSVSLLRFYQIHQIQHSLPPQANIPSVLDKILFYSLKLIPPPHTHTFSCVYRWRVWGYIYLHAQRKALMCAGACERVSMCMWRPEVDFGCLFHDSLFCEAGNLDQLGVSVGPICPVCPVNAYAISLVPALQVSCHAILGLCVDARDPSLILHDCTARSTLCALCSCPQFTLDLSNCHLLI